MNIYSVYSLIVGSDIYFGMSANVNLRWKQHQLSLKRGKHKNKKIQEAYDKNGEPEFILLHSNLSVEQALKIEKMYMAEFPNNLNMHPGGSAGRTYLGKKRPPRKSAEQKYLEEKAKYEKWASVRR
jgi:predicted GIY-YIG superfamily endonuclease